MDAISLPKVRFTKGTGIKISNMAWVAIRIKKGEVIIMVFGITAKRSNSMTWKNANS